MPDSVANLDALSILHRLRAAGYEAYFAGGCVRDLLMGQSPKDFDVATNAAPDQVRGLFKNTQAVGAAFGVILVRENKTVVEVATFRTDLDYEDGRRPTGVRFTTAEEDAQRRDFTINGLFLDPDQHRLIDFVGGQADLLAKRLRAIGNPAERFAEDHLRMLRAVRFASRFNFEIDSLTAAAIQSHAPQLTRISPERIAEELRKMLMPVSRDRAFELLWQLNLMAVLMRFLPEKPEPQGFDGTSLFLAMNDQSPVTFGLALAGLTLDYRIKSGDRNEIKRWLNTAEIKRAIQLMRQTLKISNGESDEMYGAMSVIQLIEQLPPTVATLKRFLNQPYSGEAARLLKAMAKVGIESNRIEEVLTELDRWRQTDFAPIPLVTGDDLTAAGASPGPKFKRALDIAYDAQLEGRIETTDQAIQLAMQVLNGPTV